MKYMEKKVTEWGTRPSLVSIRIVEKRVRTLSINYATLTGNQ